MPYNPNGPTQEIEIPTIGDIVSPLTNPATYAYWQLAKPRNWDPSQGFKGFGFSGIFRHKQSRKLLGESYKQAFKTKGIGKVTQTLGVSYNVLFGKVKGQSGKYIDYSSGWGRRTIREGKMASGRIGQIQNAIYNELVSGGTKKKVADRQASKLAREWYEKGFSNEFKETSKNIYKQTIFNKIRENKGYYSKGLGDLKPLSNKFKYSSIGMGKALKLGMTGMKVASFVGLASLAWGIASAVGEPIGRGIISTANETLKSYEERFMPEVGGKLRLSYLTRGAATERQRAIEAISKANINGRSAFGQEASYLHQG